MFGLGWAELLVVGIVALVVIGPKDLPEMFRQLGRFTAKARAMAGEFSRAMEQAAKESGAADVAKDLKNVASAKSMAERLGELGNALQQRAAAAADRPGRPGGHQRPGV